MNQEDNEEEQGEEGERAAREELDPKDTRMAKFVKAIKPNDYKGMSDIPMCDGRMNDKEMIDWFRLLKISLIVKMQKMINR